MSLALPSVFCPIYFPLEASEYCLSDTYSGVKHLSGVFLSWPAPVARVPKMQCFSQIYSGKRSAKEEQFILGRREKLHVTVSSAENKICVSCSGTLGFLDPSMPDIKQVITLLWIGKTQFALQTTESYQW